MDRSFAQGFAVFPSRGQARHWARALCRSSGLDRSRRQAPQRLWGASVREIIASHGGNAWRAVYTVRFQDAIYVLHVFQKKSTKGIATPAREIDLIKQRLAEAERDHRERQN
ncbi:MAG: type II toxin-antitoxin system RelE/ParE family toxin [Candidatus Acidiferrum sp.]